MTVLRKPDTPAPLDISRLNVGPPLEDISDSDCTRGGALVALETRVPKRHREDVNLRASKTPRRRWRRHLGEKQVQMCGISHPAKC